MLEEKQIKPRISRKNNHSKSKNQRNRKLRKTKTVLRNYQSDKSLAGMIKDKYVINIRGKKDFTIDPMHIKRISICYK